MKRIICFLLFVSVMLTALSGCGSEKAASDPAPTKSVEAEEEDPAAAAEASAVPEASPEVPAEEPVPEEVSLTPEELRENILEPAIAFHPGTAGCSLGQALAAAKILNYITSVDFRTLPAERLSPAMNDAVALLSEEEQGWLRENLPGLTELMDSVFTGYEDMRDLFDDAGALELADAAMAKEDAAEDWARLKAVLPEDSFFDEPLPR